MPLETLAQVRRLDGLCICSIKQPKTQTNSQLKSLKSDVMSFHSSHANDYSVKPIHLLDIGCHIIRVFSILYQTGLAGVLGFFRFRKKQPISKLL